MVPHSSRYPDPMSTDGLLAAQQKMRDAGVAQTAIDVFTRYHHQLADGVTGSIPEDTISPYTDPAHLDGITVDPEVAARAFDQLVVIDLNGGLGTSMGMDRAKSLAPVRDGRSFLEIIVEQVLAARAATGARLPPLFMDSFRTREDTLEVLARYPDLPVGDLPLDFLQNKEPKLRRDDLSPVTWDADPSLEWCPPGHGDIYTALQTSGILAKSPRRASATPPSPTPTTSGPCRTRGLPAGSRPAARRTPPSCAVVPRPIARAVTSRCAAPTGA